MEIIISNNANKPIYEQIRERNGLGMENILELQQVSKAFPKSGFWLKDVTSDSLCSPEFPSVGALSVSLHSPSMAC